MPTIADILIGLSIFVAICVVAYLVLKKISRDLDEESDSDWENRQ